MRLTTAGETNPAERSSARRRYLMCPPRYFDVAYRINPWMHPGKRIDAALALEQWERLRSVVEDLGHRVETIGPRPNLPDMVFAANGAVVVGNRAIASKMAAAERRGEERHYRDWLATHGIDVRAASYPCEGEGDFVLVGDGFLAGTGFRTAVAAHHEVADALGLPVTTLHLVDPRWYHLDMALFGLGGGNIAYYPGAFAPQSQLVLENHFPDAVIATEADALAFGLNALCDGHRIVIPYGAVLLADELAARGYEMIRVDVSELHRAGGSVKCCILELHRSAGHPARMTA